MPRKATPLTWNQIVREKRPGLYSDGGGLYVRVGEGGAKSWIFRYRVDGRLRDMGLGSVETFNLHEARQRARKFRQDRADGIDPIDARKAAKVTARLEAAKAMTFRQCGEGYIKAHEAEWTNAVHAKQWPRTLETYVYPVFGDFPVQDIDVDLVMKALDPIWNEKAETANRVRGRIESVLDWATARKYREGENPARWRGHLENLLAKNSKSRRVKRLAALPYQELAAFFALLRKQEGVASRMLQFAILTCARSGEVLGARWREIDLKAKVWTVPVERMKAGKEHRVPLSDATLALLGVTGAPDAPVFPRQHRGAMLALLRRMGRDDLTVHGFRSTFSDWCAEQTNFPSEVREMALAHAVGDKVEAAYRRGDLFDKRRQLADAWSRFATGADDGSNVVALPARTG